MENTCVSRHISWQLVRTCVLAHRRTRTHTHLPYICIHTPLPSLSSQDPHWPLATCSWRHALCLTRGRWLVVTPEGASQVCEWPVWPGAAPGSLAAMGNAHYAGLIPVACGLRGPGYIAGRGSPSGWGLCSGFVVLSVVAEWGRVSVCSLVIVFFPNSCNGFDWDGSSVAV